MAQQEAGRDAGAAVTVPAASNIWRWRGFFSTAELQSLGLSEEERDLMGGIITT